MSVWGEVGVGLAMANRTARLAENDPWVQRRIRRNLLMEQIETYHNEAVRLQREEERHRKRAAAKVKAANRVLLSVSKLCANADDEAVLQHTGASERSKTKKDRQQMQSHSKKARLESQAALLQKQAAAILKEADKLSKQALRSKTKEESARRELAYLERPTDDQTEATLVMEGSDLSEFD